MPPKDRGKFVAEDSEVESESSHDPHSFDTFEHISNYYFKEEGANDARQRVIERTVEGYKKAKAAATSPKETANKVVNKTNPKTRTLLLFSK